MAARDAGSAGSARRRRERRLRSMLRHDRQTVAMNLAAALHHSRDIGPGVYDGLRAQVTLSSGEEVEYVTHSSPRALKTPPSGERLGLLPEHSPQRSDRTARHSSGAAPSLSPPALQAAADDAVDHSSLAFLLNVALHQNKDEEEAARRAKKEQVKAAKDERRVRGAEDGRRTLRAGQPPAQPTHSFQRKHDRGSRGCDRLQRFPQAACEEEKEEEEEEEKDATLEDIISECPSCLAGTFRCLSFLKSTGKNGSTGRRLLFFFVFVLRARHGSTADTHFAPALWSFEVAHTCRVAHGRKLCTVDASAAFSARAVCTWKPGHYFRVLVWCWSLVEEYSKVGLLGNDFWVVPRIQRLASLISGYMHCDSLRKLSWSSHLLSVKVDSGPLFFIRPVHKHRVRASFGGPVHRHTASWPLSPGQGWGGHCTQVQGRRGLAPLIRCIVTRSRTHACVVNENN